MSTKVKRSIIAALFVAISLVPVSLLPSSASDREVREASSALQEVVLRAGGELLGEAQEVGNLGMNNGCEGEVSLAVRSLDPERLMREISPGAGAVHVFCAQGGALSWWLPAGIAARAGCTPLVRFRSGWTPDVSVDLGIGATEYSSLLAFASEHDATHIIRWRSRLSGSLVDLDWRCH